MIAPGWVLFLFFLAVAFFALTLTVIVLFCLDCCNYGIETETVMPTAHYIFSPDQTPPGSTLNVSPGFMPRADVTWRRDGALAWLSFNIEFPFTVTPTTNLQSTLQFSEFVVEISSLRWPLMQRIVKKDSLFEAVGEVFIRQPQTSAFDFGSLACHVDMDRRPGTCIDIKVTGLKLPVDPNNGTAYFSCSGSIVFPVATADCCESCRRPNTAAYIAQTAPYN